MVSLHVHYLCSELNIRNWRFGTEAWKNWQTQNKSDKKIDHKICRQWQRNRGFAKKSDSLIILSFQPNVVDLGYLKLWILLDQIFQIKYIKQRQVAKIYEFWNLSLWQRLNSFKLMEIHIVNVITFTCYMYWYCYISVITFTCYMYWYCYISVITFTCYMLLILLYKCITWGITIFYLE